MLSPALTLKTRTTLAVLVNGVRDIARLCAKEISTVVPTSITRRFAATSTATLTLDGDSGTLIFRGKHWPLSGFDGKSTAPVDAALRRTLVTLHLPADRVIRQQLSVPAAVAQRLGDALESLVAQHSPFELHEVMASARTIDRSGEVCRIELVYGLRSEIDAIIAQAAALGWPPDAVSLDGGVSSIPFCTARRKANQRRRSVSVALFLSPLVCSAFLVWAIAERQQRDLSALREAVAIDVKLSQRRQVLEEKINQLIQAESLPERLEASRLRHAVLLNAIARILPEHAVLREIEIKKDRGRLVVVAPESFDMMQALSQTGLIRPTDTAVMSTQPGGEQVLAIGFAVQPRPRT